MGKKITPHPSIIQALQSESETATPFSRIPGFIKKYAITKEQQEALISILSSIGNKEIAHLDTRVVKIQNDKNDFDPELYHKILQIEAGKDEKGNKTHTKLIGLAKEIIASEMGTPVRQILKHVKGAIGSGTIDPSAFDNPHTDESENLSNEEKKLVQQEQQVRIIMNALIMGAGHRIFDKVETDPKYPKTINKISPDLYQAYYDMVYTNLKYMREVQPAEPSGNNTGSMQLITKENETMIKIKADIFPVLLHEMAKGVVEYIAYTRYNNMRPEITKSILSVDSRQSEHWMMLIGPQIYKQLFFLVKEATAQYNEKKGLLESKEESDYIIPILSHITQLPADQFLTLMETILRQDQDGQISIGAIAKVIDGIHDQYEGYLASNTAPKTKLTIKEIMEQLTRELNLGKKAQMYVKSALPEVQERLQGQGHSMGDKKLARKIAEYYMDNAKKFQLSDLVDQSWLMEVGDAIQGLKKSRIEQAAFGIIHEQQKKFHKRTKNHEKQSINIHPRFPLSVLEEAKKNIHPDVLEDIDNQIVELIQNGSITQWLQDHDDMSTKLSQLTERFITLDDVTPECLVEREDNRGLYELTNLEQLKREAQSMGGHCVPDYINYIKDGTLKVFSLRYGTQSRRTIGYKPHEQIIHQVKGYTNKKKNATLTEEDPDYQQVLEALQYLLQQLPINQINDIHNSGLIFTNQGLFQSDEFIEKVKQQGETGTMRIITGLCKLFLKNDIAEEDFKKLARVENLKLGFQIGEYHLIYSRNSRSIDVTNSGKSLELQDPSYAKIIERMKFICTHGNVTAINNAEKIFTEGGMVLTNKGLLVSNEFIQTIKENYMYAVMVFQLQKDAKLTLSDIDILPKLNLKNIKIIESRIGKISIQYNTENKEIKTTGIPSSTQDDNSKIGTVIQSLLSIKKHEFFADYDDYPIFGIGGLCDDMARIQKNGKYGIVKRQGGSFKEILKCEYDSLPQFRTRGLGKNDIIIMKNGKEGIIKREEDGTRSEILPCMYDNLSQCTIISSGTQEGGVRKNEKRGILRRTNDDIRTEILSCEYDDIAKPSRYGFLKNERIVTKNGKKGIIKENENGTWTEMLPCEYDNTPQIGIAGLSPDQAIMIKGGKHGIIKRIGNTFKEIVPCIYDASPIFGSTGLEANEALVIKNNKKGFIKIFKEECIELMPCEYDEAPDFGAQGLAANEAAIQKNGKYGIIKRTENGFETVIHCEYDKMPTFGTEGLVANEAIAKKDGKYGIIRKNEDETLTQIVNCEYENIPEFGENILQKNEIVLSNKSKHCMIKKLPKFGMDTGFNQAKVKGNGKDYLRKKNPDGSRIQISYETYEDIRYGVSGLASHQAWVRTRTGYGIIQDNKDGTRNEILPCIYDHIPFTTSTYKETIQKKRNMVVVKSNFRYGIMKRDEGKRTQIVPCEYRSIDFDAGGIGDDEVIVEDDNNLGYGIIKINGDGTTTTTLECAYQKILSPTKDAIIVKKDDIQTIIKKDENGYRSKTFFSTKDTILQYGVEGLGPEEILVNIDGPKIVRKDESGKIDIIHSDYIIKDFGRFGLKGNEARAKKKEGKMGIIQRSPGGEIKELLPCIYDAIGSFGDKHRGLTPDEVIVIKEGKCGIVKRIETGFKEILPCDFYSIGSLGEDGLPTDEVRTQKEKDDKYTIIKRTENGYIDTGFGSNKIIKFHFGERGLPSNMSFLSTDEDRAYNIVRKNKDGTYEELVDEDGEYYFDKGDRDGLLDNEFRVSFSYGNKIVRINNDSWEEISEGYEEIYEFGQHGCSQDEAFVCIGSCYGIIKRDVNGYFKEIVKSNKYYLDEDFKQYIDYDNEHEFPIVFYPKKIDEKRIIIAIRDRGEKSVLIENDESMFIEIENKEEFLERNNELDTFYDNVYAFME